MASLPPFGQPEAAGRKYFLLTEKGKATYARNKNNRKYAKRVLETLV